MKKQLQGKYPLFIHKARRDKYLYKLTTYYKDRFNVRAKVVWGHRIEIRYVEDVIGALTPEQAEGVLYTVEDV